MSHVATKFINRFREVRNYGFCTILAPLGRFGSPVAAQQGANGGSQNFLAYNSKQVQKNDVPKTRGCSFAKSDVVPAEACFSTTTESPDVMQTLMSYFGEEYMSTLVALGDTTTHEPMPEADSQNGTSPCQFSKRVDQIFSTG